MTPISAVLRDTNQCLYYVNNLLFRHVSKVALAASASLSCSEPDIHSRFERGFDDDVIGMPEHVNKQDSKTGETKEHRYDATSGNTKVREHKVIETKDHKIDSVEVKKERLVDQPVNKQAKQDVVNDYPVHKRREEDFPSLPGAPKLSMHMNKQQITEEAFPALGKSMKAKTNGVTKSKQSVQNWGKQINGIPVKTVKKKGKSYSKQTGRVKLESDQDFPSLGKVEKQSTSCGTVSPIVVASANNTEKPVIQVTSRLKNPPPEPTKPPPPPVISKQPPPGVSKQPPPGMTKQPSPGMTKQPPPGMTKQPPPGMTKQPPPGLSKGKNKTERNKPPGFSAASIEVNDNNQLERNLRLLAMLQAVLDDFNMGIFKNVSGEFRRGTRTAEAYYNDISELLGVNLQAIFSELVALLPDEKKRQDLLLVHNNAKVLRKQRQELTSKADYTNKSTWGGVAARIENEYIESECGQCGARFPKDKETEHMESHTESFPALPTAVKKKNNYAYMPVRTSRASSAWGK